MKQLLFLICLLGLAPVSFAQKKPKAKAVPTTTASAAVDSVIHPASDSVFYMGRISSGEMNSFITFCLNDVDYLSDKGRRQWLTGFLQKFQAMRIPPKVLPPATPATTPKDTTSKKP